MKDYIYVYDESGKKEKMEVVFTYNDLRKKINYIVYRSLKKKNEFFAARYNPNKSISEIETNLCDEEKKMIESLFKNNYKEVNHD